MRPFALLAILLSIAASGCQTTEEAPAINHWSPAPLARVDDGRIRSGATSGMPQFAATRSSQTTFIEGTGRFVGEQSSAARRPAAEPRGEGVTLNLVNVPAPQAAKTILGDILAVRYTVAPGIEGKITIQTPVPVTKSAAVDLFEAALRANGAAIVNADGLYRIVPADQAAVGANIRTGNAPDGGVQVGSSVRLVQLKFVSASEIRRVLEPIAPRGGVVRVDDARNIITLSGNSQEVAGMLEAIALFDVDVMKGMSFALVPVKISQPDAIATELRTIFASDREGPTAGMVQFLPNKRLGAILVISPQAQYLRRAETWVRRLDAQAQGSEKQLFTYSVQNRRAQELVEVLQSMFTTETGGTRTSTTTRNVAPQHQEANIRSAGGAQSAGTSATRLTPARASGQTGVGQGGFGGQEAYPPASAAASAAPRTSAISAGRDEVSDGPRVRIVADDTKNAILIEATPDDYKRILRVLSTLDVMPKQVLIEATIAEVSLNDELKFGLRWHIQSRSADYTFTDAASGAVSSVFPGFSYALTAANIAMTLNTLSQITDVNVVSSPSLTVMDSKPAVLQIGDQVPITTQSATSVLTTGAPVVNSISYRDTGVILSITPRINESGRVLLDIEQEVSSVAQTTTSGIDSPTIRQRRIKTSVVVNDGDALVLGGLIQDSHSVARTQTPILGDIPIIGNAFKHKKNALTKTELIILITPRVIRNLQEARGVTEEFQRELAANSHRKGKRWRSIANTMKRTFE